MTKKAKRKKPTKAKVVEQIVVALADTLEEITNDPITIAEVMYTMQDLAKFAEKFTHKQLTIAKRRISLLRYTLKLEKLEW